MLSRLSVGVLSSRMGVLRRGIHLSLRLRGFRRARDFVENARGGDAAGANVATRRGGKARQDVDSQDVTYGVGAEERGARGVIQELERPYGDLRRDQQGRRRLQ